MVEYKVIRLGDCLSMIENGATIKQKEGAGGYPITRIETLSNDRFNRDRLGYADIDNIDSLKNHILDNEDLIMSHINSRPFLGRTVIYFKKDDETIIHGMNVLRIKTKKTILNPIYAYYYFKTPHFRKAIDNIRTDAINQSSINTNNIKDIKIHIPNIAEQEKVVDVLRGIDKKIEKNEEMNAELEAMAKQLYDYWFVQFDFPDENGNPYKSSGGKMVYNSTLKREIPADWEVKSLSEIANITMGQSPDGSSYNEEGNGTIFYQGSTDFGIRFPSVRMYTTEPSRFAIKGDILMSVRAPVGDTNIAYTDCCIGRGLAALNSKIGSATHLYFILGDLKAKFDRLNAAGTTFGAITKDELYSLPVVKPAESILRKYEELCSSMFDKQMCIGHEIEHLTHLRDSLLPMLMNGQITVE